MRRISGYIDLLNEKVGRATAWLTSALVLVVCYDVFTRYFLRHTTVAVLELEWHLFSVIFLLGAAFTLKDNRHVRVDVFYVRFSPKLRALVDLIGTIVFTIPFSVVAIIASRNFVWNSWLVGEKSPDPGGLPGRYLLKAMIPLAFVLVLLQAISQIIKVVEQFRQAGSSPEGGRT